MQTRFAAFALTALVTLPLAADVVTAGQRAGTITSTSKPAQKKPPATMEERLAAIEKRLDDLENADIDQLEADHHDPSGRTTIPPRPQRRGRARQLRLFAPEPHPLVQELKGLKLEEMSPLQALQELRRIRDSVQQDGELASV